MIKYIQEKKIDYCVFKDILSNTEKTNQFTNLGPAKRSLELELEKKLNIESNKAVVCVSNGTLALHAIYLHLNKKFPNSKIVTPSFTFPSCIVGAFNCSVVDIDETYSMELSKDNLEKYDVFVITNLFGTYPSNILEWVNACKENNKILIFDNAGSPLTNINGINFCNLGDFSFGSLHHTKYLGFGEGGFLVCDKDLYMEFNRICGFGFKNKNGERIFDTNSSNYKMSDVAAASILQHIRSYNLDLHISIQNRLVDGISKIKGVDVFNYKPGVILGNLPLLFDKDIDKNYFHKNKIEAQKYYKPLKDLKNSTSLYKRILNLPLNSSLKDKDIKKILTHVEIASK